MGKRLKNRYVALKFTVNGQFHFGLARVAFAVTSKNTFYGLLTGYAYETIPNKPLNPGQRKGMDEIDNSVEQPNPDDAGPGASLTSTIPEATTLGALAMGAPGLSIWRRKESAVQDAR
jgi:hypothetical protein